MTEIVIETHNNKPDCDSQSNTPLEKERRPTDIRFLKLLAIFCIVWLGIVIYAEFHGSMDHSKYVEIGCNIFLYSLLSLFLCLLYIFLITRFTKIIVYFIIIKILSLFFCLTCYEAALMTQFSIQESFGLLLITAMLFILLVVLFVTYRKQINIACEVIEEISKCITFFPSLLLFPVVPIIGFFTVLYFTINVLLQLDSISSQYRVVPFYIMHFHALNILIMYWLLGFVRGFSQMVLSGTFSTWYWTRNKLCIPSCVLFQFMNIIKTNHLGTIVYGSLITNVCQIARGILKFIKIVLKVTVCYGKCYKYLFSNLEESIKYVNFDAYIVCANHGHDFLTSARRAYDLNVKNNIKNTVFNVVLVTVLLAGMIFTTSIPALVIQQIENRDWMTFLVLGSSMIITCSIFMVVKIAVDTIFLCVIEDHEKNDGSTEHPYFMTTKLKQLLMN